MAVPRAAAPVAPAHALSVMVLQAGPRVRTIGLVLAAGLIASIAIAHGGAAITVLAWITVASLLRGPASGPLPATA